MEIGMGRISRACLFGTIAFAQMAQANFLSVDPKAPKPGDVFGFNRYAYANNNPVNNTDPDGRYACGSESKAACPQITGFVNTMNSALSNLTPGSKAFNSLSAVSAHIGTLGDNNGVVLNAGSINTAGVLAVANSATTMTIDISKASTLSDPFRQYNPGISAKNLATDFGAGAVAHEGQHQLDYLNPSMGYPTDRASEHATEMNAYRTELGVAKGLGISTDLYAPGALQKDVNSRVNQAANASTNAFCKVNGC
jgi:uncharacterized protein RhaS with RHS repeats